MSTSSAIVKDVNPWVYGASSVGVGAATLGAATAVSTQIGESKKSPQDAAIIGAGVGAAAGALFAGGKVLSRNLKSKYGFSSLAKMEDRKIAMQENRLLNLTGDLNAHKDRKVIVANTAGEVYLNSINHHVITPAINTVKNLATGRFNNITASNIAATAVAGYGVYEAGEAVKSIGDGDFSDAAISLASFGASKMIYMGAEAGIRKGIKLHQEGESIPKHIKDYITGKDGIRRDANDAKLYAGLGYVWSKKVNPATEYLTNVSKEGSSTKEKLEKIRELSDSEKKTVQKQIRTAMRYGLELKDLATRRHREEYELGYNTLLSKAKNDKVGIVKNNIAMREQEINDTVFSEKGIEALENAEKFEGGKHNNTGSTMYNRVTSAVNRIHDKYEYRPGGSKTINDLSLAKENAIFTLMHPNVDAKEYGDLFHNLEDVLLKRNEVRVVDPNESAEAVKAAEEERMNVLKDLGERYNKFIKLGEKASELGVEIDNTEAIGVIRDYERSVDRMGSYGSYRNWASKSRDPEWWEKNRPIEYPYLPHEKDVEKELRLDVENPIFAGIPKDEDWEFRARKAINSRKIKSTNEQLELFKKIRNGWRNTDPDWGRPEGYKKD